VVIRPAAPVLRLTSIGMQLPLKTLFQDTGIKLD